MRGAPPSLQAPARPSRFVLLPCLIAAARAPLPASDGLLFLFPAQDDALAAVLSLGDAAGAVDCVETRTTVCTDFLCIRAVGSGLWCSDGAAPWGLGGTKVGWAAWEEGWEEDV